MKYIATLLILCTSAFGSDLVSKAQIIEDILNNSEKQDIVQAFEATSAIGASVEAMRTHGIQEEVEAKYQENLVKLIQEVAGTAVIDTFTLQELTILKKMSDGSKEEKSLALKTVCLTTSQKPRMMQKYSAIMMEYSKSLKQERD
jgi:2-iminoacetate synthase ThiH